MLYTEKDLVQFGYYLLSSDREIRIVNGLQKGEDVLQKLRKVTEEDLQLFIQMRSCHGDN